jgi:DNA-binding winged helix-turn-helix (wHTH) protein/tetratricopeptide (TPR) repeat protein
MSLAFKGSYRFDEFEFNPSERLFLRNGTPLLVSPKALEILACLVSHPGRVVTKDELLKTVWPDSFVEESNLTQHISLLRKALGDKSNCIVTVSGLGYRFTGHVQALAPAEAAPKMQPADMLVHQVRERTRMVIEESSPAALPVKTARLSIRSWPYAVVAAGVLVLAIGVGWRRLQPARSAQFLKVVVADFMNTTGDATFDRTLRRALEIDLAQSPFLDVMSEREAVNTLQLMGQPGDAALTGNVARESCVRSNRQVLLAGSIASVGHAYLLTLEATDCNSGKVLASAKRQAAAKEKVLDALDAVAERIRRGLGESATSLESYQVPILQATTASLEALKAYSLGNFLSAQGKEELETLPFYQRAVELDPHFAMAYGVMAVDYYNLHEYNRAAEYFKKAFDLSDGVSEREKLVIQAHYYSESQKDLEQGIKTYKLWAATYPHEWVPWVDLANDLTQLGQYAAAIPAGQWALELEPNGRVNYIVLARALRRANRFAEAKAVAQQAVQRGKDSPSLHAILFEIAFAEHDQGTLSREIEWTENRESDWYFLDDRASAAAAIGKYAQAEKLFHHSSETAERQSLPEAADGIVLDQATMELEFGLPDASRATLRRIHDPDSDSSDLVILRAKLGDPSSAEHFLAEHSNPTHDTLMTYRYVPLVRATLAMEHQKPLDAIAALEPATHFELTDYTVPTLRAAAYLCANRPEMAAVEYQKILANQGVDPTSPLYPLAYLGLARADALENHKAESREEYEKLFAFWKDADADVPVLKQARWEYSRLR